MSRSVDDPCEGLPNGNYPDPDECTRIYSCSNGIAYLMDCPEDLYYNEKTDQCDSPENVDCGCSDGYEQYDRKCYKAFGDKEPYEEAFATCRDDGGVLAMPRDEGTHEFLIPLKNKVDSEDAFWLGINRVEGGEFAYYDGTPLTFQAWYPGEPSDTGGQEDCIMFYGPGWDNKWNDIPCFGPEHPFICEKFYRV
ncbi:PREDICTED: lactose-binding lectin l-2-like [Branchiostoma belcheri]|uniref:chitinase n=1 Tax=Branchiostoma belcheri TaxID=7741 RepID=A0A6P4Z0X1_BRABE|nr:PREDICTED: lactose-binding lectin l-2-like [Branchiostoma belcheri]